MKVLVACEFSGRVREAFAQRGHYAVSCDLLSTEIVTCANSEHYQGDVLDILYDDWDLIIAHPPCTYLAHSGVQWLKAREGRWEKMLEAVDFFNLFLDHPCQKICIENPVMHSYAKQRLRKPNHSQKIQPYFFGHPEKKKTYLWLKGLPRLKVTNNVETSLFTIHAFDKNKIHMEPDSLSRQKNRSRTYQGVADAMAAQWG